MILIPVCVYTDVDDEISVYSGDQEPGLPSASLGSSLSSTMDQPYDLGTYIPSIQNGSDHVNSYSGDASGG